MLVLFKIIQSKKIEGGTESVKLQSARTVSANSPWNPGYSHKYESLLHYQFWNVFYLGSTLYKSCLLIILINK